MPSRGAPMAVASPPVITLPYTGQPSGVTNKPAVPGQRVPASALARDKPIYGVTLVQYIVAGASRRRIDPAAVLSIVPHEGGFYGSVGDSGTSFGPWQLHGGSNVRDPRTQGALPQSIWS